MLFKRDVNLFWFVSFICTNILQVLAISEGLHDVYSLGKEAATAHAALMEDLSKVLSSSAEVNAWVLLLHR